MKRFSEKFITNLKGNGSKQNINEGDGFILRIGTTGFKTFFYRYTIKSKKKYFKLGVYPKCSLADARKKHLEARNLFLNGIDPAEDKIIKEEEKKTKEITIEWLSNDFYNRYILVNRKAPIHVKQMLDHDIIPSLGKLKLTNITTRQITLALEKIVDRGSNVQANKVLKIIKQMFTYAISKGLTERNPATVIQTKNIGGIEIPRDRFLSYKEIKTLWNFLDSKKHSAFKGTKNALKILLLTGVRTGSLVQAQWDEFDYDNDLWIIPPKHLKLKKIEKQVPHKVHLTPLVKELLLNLNNDKPFVLPHRLDKNKHITEKVFGKAVRRLRKQMVDIEEDFNTHDFRTTISTHLAELKIAPHIGELIIGHKMQGMLAVYNKHEYLEEREQALILWSNKIIEIVK